MRLALSLLRYELGSPGRLDGIDSDRRSLEDIDSDRRLGIEGSLDARPPWRPPGGPRFPRVAGLPAVALAAG